MELEDGDTLTISGMPWIASVMGSAYNPTSIVYTKGKTVDFYLNKVGGPTPDAEEGEGTWDRRSGVSSQGLRIRYHGSGLYHMPNVIQFQ